MGHNLVRTMRSKECIAYVFREMTPFNAGPLILSSVHCFIFRENNKDLALFPIGSDVMTAMGDTSHVQHHDTAVSSVVTSRVHGLSYLLHDDAFICFSRKVDSK